MKTTEFSKSSLMQSMKNEFNLTYKEIAVIFQCSQRNVWNKCNGEWGITSWVDRENKDEINKYVAKLLKHLRYEVYFKGNKVKSFKKLNDANKFSLKKYGMESIFAYVSANILK